MLFALACLVGISVPAFAGSEAPQWMHALTSAQLPQYDDKTDAVLLYSETNVSVLSADKMKTVTREAYKILRPGGRDYGDVVVFTNMNKKITSLRGWSIPAQGKDFEVKDKDAIEVSPPKIEGGELISDVKAKVLHIPASEPGNIIGYEYEVEERPLVLQDEWHFQERVPVRESHYSIQVPAGWEYSASFLNYPEAKPVQSSATGASWKVSDVKGTRPEEDMPPWKGLVGQMVISFYPARGATLNGFSNWQQMGNWYTHLISGRMDASPDIKQKVQSLSSSAPTQLEKMKSIALFIQQNIRYVAIELGIGGWQPHPAADIYNNKYGDCKDKTTLMVSMLREIGVDAYYVVINTERGSITAKTPAHQAFDHVIVAIKLPEGVSDPSLVATITHPKLGKLLFFDPTSELTPFGQIGGYLQDNYGLLVTPDGGELLALPKQPASLNSIARSATLTLDPTGRLQGQVTERRVGDRAASQRHALRTTTKDTDKIKLIESVLAGSLANFQITKASVMNAHETSEPFGFEYTFQADNYAKKAGNLLLVRPRVIGVKTRGILETKEPRQFPVEFEGPVLDTDQFEIAVPEGYEVDELPPPVDAEFSFATYHSKTEAKDKKIKYTRSYEIKELSVPVAKVEELKKFYRIIANDERNTAILRPAK